MLQNHIIPEGNRLFQQAGKWADNWQLQQDKAPVHKTKENMQCIDANVPGGHSLAWPPNSLDSSPIENLWAWMEDQPGARAGINNTDELQQRLINTNDNNNIMIVIRDSITVSQLRQYFRGMN